MDLMCVEAVQCCNAILDPVLLQDNRVLENMLKAEDLYLPNAALFNQSQAEVQPYMRKIVAEWMLEVCEEQRCEEEVFPLSLNYIDRFLSVVNNWKKEHLQLLAAAAMFVASKLRETVAMAADKLVAYTDNSITMDELFAMESVLLQALKWDVSALTPHDFLEQIATRLPVDEPVKTSRIIRHAQTFCTVCYTDFTFSPLRPSLVAAGAVFAATLGLQGADWAEKHNVLGLLQNLTHCEESHLLACHQRIEELLINNFPEYKATSSKRVNSHETNNACPKTPNSKMPPATASTPTDVREVIC